MINREQLEELYRKGLLTHKPIVYMDYSDKVKAYVSQGMTKTNAVIEVSKLVGVHQTTIWNACRFIASIK